MKRYYVEMYSNRKFMGNLDCNTMEEIVSYLEDYIDKIIVRDTEQGKEYIVKKGKTK